MAKNQLKSLKPEEEFFKTAYGKRVALCMKNFKISREKAEKILIKFFLGRTREGRIKDGQEV